MTDDLTAGLLLGFIAGMLFLAGAYALIDRRHK